MQLFASATHITQQRYCPSPQQLKLTHAASRCRRLPRADPLYTIRWPSPCSKTRAVGQGVGKLPVCCAVQRPGQALYKIHEGLGLPARPTGPTVPQASSDSPGLVAPAVRERMLPIDDRTDVTKAFEHQRRTRLLLAATRPERAGAGHRADPELASVQGWIFSQPNGAAETQRGAEHPHPRGRWCGGMAWYGRSSTSSPRRPTTPKAVSV